jgi:transcriptional regulator with XRE-family HTH domain
MMFIMKQAIAVAFGHVLRAAREAAGLSQQTLALRAEIDRTYPSLLERGLRSPSLGTLMNLAPVLGIPPEALVKRTEAQLLANGSPAGARRAKKHARRPVKPALPTA